MNQILTFFWNIKRGQITFMGEWKEREPQLRSRSREVHGVGWLFYSVLVGKSNWERGRIGKHSNQDGD